MLLKTNSTNNKHRFNKSRNQGVNTIQLLILLLSSWLIASKNIMDHVAYLLISDLVQINFCVSQFSIHYTSATIYSNAAYIYTNFWTRFWYALKTLVLNF